MPARNNGAKSADHPILFQQYFKSVGPRTYAAQVKQAGNGNHYLVLTESKRDEKTDEPRKSRLFIFSEDFAAFIKLFGDAARFVQQNPVSAEVRAKRERFWKKNPDGKPAARQDRRQASAPVSRSESSRPVSREMSRETTPNQRAPQTTRPRAYSSASSHSAASDR